MSTDKLVIISQSHWETLRDLYLTNWPTNILGYYTIDNYIRWIEKLPTIKDLFLYSLNGEWSDGTYAVVVCYKKKIKYKNLTKICFQNGNHLCLNTLDESNMRLKSLLSLLDWSPIDIVSTLRKKHRSAVIEVIETKNLIRNFDEETLLYYLPKEESQNLKVRQVQLLSNIATTNANS